MTVKEHNGILVPVGFRNEYKAAGWFSFMNCDDVSLATVKASREFRFLWWCYMEDYLKWNPHLEEEDAVDIVRHQILFDFSRIYGNKLQDIAELAKGMYGNGAYGILEENPLFDLDDLKVLRGCLQREA